MIFSSTFLHAVTFSHVLHLDVLKSQIVKTVMYGYNAEQPIAIPIYTVLPYCVISNVHVLLACQKLVLLHRNFQQNSCSAQPGQHPHMQALCCLASISRLSLSSV